MAGCEILDIECIFVNEIFGSITLAVIATVIFYLMIAGKLRMGAEVTIALAFPFAIILAMMIGGFSIVYAFSTIIVALMVAFLFNRIIGNR